MYKKIFLIALLMFIFSTYTYTTYAQPENSCDSCCAVTWFGCENRTRECCEVEAQMLCEESIGSFCNCTAVEFESSDEISGCVGTLDNTPAPTISQWGMIAFGFIAGLFGLWFLRKKKAISAR